MEKFLRYESSLIYIKKKVTNYVHLLSSFYERFDVGLDPFFPIFF